MPFRRRQTIQEYIMKVIEKISATLVVVVVAIGCSLSASAQTFPVSGSDVPSLRQLDSAMIELMREYDLPGGQLAVAKDGRLVYDRGFGYADTATKEVVQPSSVFRIASSSKPVTMAAIHLLIDRGQLDLHARMTDVWGNLTPVPGESLHPSLDSVTVRMLLRHMGGWDSRSTGDIQYLYYREAAQALDVPEPADGPALVRFLMSRPTQFKPGTGVVYSNFGYNVLGRIIEAVSGKAYEDFVREEIWAKTGTTVPRIGGTRQSDRLPNEVTYYTPPEQGTVYSIFCDEKAKVSMAYGGDFVVRTADAHGGWVCSASDMVRFLTSLDTATSRPHLVSGTQIREIEQRPGIPSFDTKPVYQGSGFLCSDDGSTWNHAGALSGTSSSMWRVGTSGVSYAWVFNSLPVTRMNEFYPRVDSILRSILEGVQGANWPQHDFFSTVRVTDNTDRTDFRVLPNPTSSSLEIYLPNDLTLPSTVFFTSTEGKQYMFSVSEPISTISTSQIPAGSYVVSLDQGPSIIVVVAK